ncbi:hypothetical protein BD779DRAFT_1573290 [Infundibulicybe gibba]|nr:hypothetical protein BD779DRAFT_1573290 [Infundibulicybe gibba]
MERALRPILDNLNELERGQVRIWRNSAIVYNGTCSTGDNASFVVVPFADGTDPTEQPHYLPPLKSCQAVYDLNSRQRDAYCRGYGLARRNRNVEQCTKFILTAIGSIAI